MTSDKVAPIPRPCFHLAMPQICLALGFTVALCASRLVAASPEVRGAGAPTKPALPSIDVSGFRSGSHHWRDIRDPSRFIQVLPNQPAYTPVQVGEIVTNILLFQRSNGGWPKDYDMLAVLTEEQKAAVLVTRDRNDTSFDNGSIHSQVDYLARAFAAAGDRSWSNACVRGLDFMLTAQYPSGGFPQRHPKPTRYHAHITFNDSVMIGNLNVLLDAANPEPYWIWLDPQRREHARKAVQRGIECILKCQIEVNGIPTGWCQQHDPHTFKAVSARTFELASICPQETAEIVRFLMRLKSPNPEIIRATDAAVAWMKQAQLAGIRIEKQGASLERFERHDADFDAVLVVDAKAPPLWARHYEIETNRPIFAGRDGIKRYALAEIERERRTGTPWYGRWPQALLEKDYVPWRKQVRTDPPK